MEEQQMFTIHLSVCFMMGACAVLFNIVTLPEYMVWSGAAALGFSGFEVVNNIEN